MSEITSGDIIIIQHPTTLVEEVRSVTLVVSDISCSIKYFLFNFNFSMPFSSDLISNTSFEYVKKPKEKIDPKKIQEDEKDKKIREEREALGLLAGDLYIIYI